MKRTLGVWSTLVVLAAVMVKAPAVEASQNCPSPNVGGRTVAWVMVGSTKVPVKKVPFRRGQALHPPDTNQAAGLSNGHAPLAARMGTTVITWHVRFGPGCNGTLNPLLEEPIGSTFSVRQVGKAAKEYRIVARHEVRKGRYQAAWFRQTGPHQLALFTCAGFKSGQFRNTAVIIAKPVSAEQTPPDQPDPQVVVAAPEVPAPAPPPPADTAPGTSPSPG